MGWSMVVGDDRSVMGMVGVRLVAYMGDDGCSVLMGAGGGRGR